MKFTVPNFVYIKEWLRNYIEHIPVDIITYPWFKFNAASISVGKNGLYTLRAKLT